MEGKSSLLFCGNYRSKRSFLISILTVVREIFKIYLENEHINFKQYS